MNESHGVRRVRETVVEDTVSRGSSKKTSDEAVQNDQQTLVLNAATEQNGELPFGE